ncbi:Nucleolar complex protein 3 homolog [Gryllus bimaculatus]|nr:Nucleolar complex protein 3 homolog [Gryllus bimaculatus]
MAKKKGIKISKVKRQNHMRNKLGKRGKLKSNKKTSKYYGIKPQDNSQKPEPQQEEEIAGEEMLTMMEPEDLLYLQNSVAARSYGILQKLRSAESKSGKRGRGDVARNKLGDNDALENAYEEEMGRPESKRTKLLLPIKTKEGLVMRSTEVDVLEEERQRLEREVREKEKEEEKKRKKEEKKKKKKGLTEGEEEMKEEGEEEEEENELELMEKEFEEVVPQSIAAVDLLACREDLLRKRKFQIGLLASGLLETPEMKVRNFKFLLEILNTEDSEVQLTVQKLAAVSLMEVFKDLLPSYQIKHQEKKGGVKLKKTTQQLENYEKSLLKAYKTYLQSLEQMTKAVRRKRGDSKFYDEKAVRLGELAVRCMTELLVRHPYFNFSPNIAQDLVHFLDNKNSNVRDIVMNGLRTVIKEDKRGEITLHIVRRINQLVRTKNHSVRPEVLTVLLALRLRDVNLDAEKEAELRDKKFKARKQKILSLSKRERKRQKRMEELEKEMLETKAEENKQSKQRNLTEVTKTVFTIFFRVLKCAPSSKLLSVTLEGLAKFAHCINLEFFQDLVNVLDHLLEEGNLGHVEQLHCVETVFTILSGQGEALNIDPLRFYSHLYRSLLHVHAGSTNADALIVLRALEKAIVARRRKVSLQRLMAFIKRLSTLAPHLLHGAALGYLAVIRNVLMQTSACDVLLDTDATHGDGIYQPELPEPEYCGAGASCLWELLLMKRHYHPDVRKMAQNILNNEESTLAPEVAKLSPAVLAETYNCSQMVFRPAVPPPKKVNPRPHRGDVIFKDDKLAQYMQNVEKSVNFEGIQNWQESEFRSQEKMEIEKEENEFENSMDSESLRTYESITENENGF